MATQNSNYSDPITEQRNMLRIGRIDEYEMQFLKTCVVLNAGSIVAILGLLQALAGKDMALALGFRAYAAASVLMFSTGIASCLAVFALRLRILWVSWDKNLRSKMLGTHRWLVGFRWIAPISFFIGVGSVMLGIYRVLG